MNVNTKLDAVEYTCPSSGSVHSYEHGATQVLGARVKRRGWPAITGLGLIVNADFGSGSTGGVVTAVPVIVGVCPTLLCTAAAVRRGDRHVQRVANIGGYGRVGTARSTRDVRARRAAVLPLVGVAPRTVEPRAMEVVSVPPGALPVIVGAAVLTGDAARREVRSTYAEIGQSVVCGPRVHEDGSLLSAADSMPRFDMTLRCRGGSTASLRCRAPRANTSCLRRPEH